LHLGWALAMLNFFQAIVLGVLQGVTELFPVSGLAIR
jgi:undecaprenyl pyrophosphate phosphatase UppP